MLKFVRRCGACGTPATLSVCTPQNIAEFWSVATRPSTARGGLGVTVEEAARRVRVTEKIVDVVSEPANSYRRWKMLVTRYNVSGRQVHDARLVAIMTALRIRRVLTLNDVDFRRYYPLVTAVTPETVLTAGPE